MRQDTTEPSMDNSRDESLIARRDEALARHPDAAPPPRRWPLWVCVLALGGVVAWQQWQLQQLQDMRGQQSDQLSRQVSRLKGDVENDARLLGDVDERLAQLTTRVDESLSARIDGLTQTDESLADSLAEQQAAWQERLAALSDTLTASQDAQASRLAALAESTEAQLEGLRQAGDNRTTLLSALQGSVSALESLSRDGRATLKARLDAQADTLAHLETELKAVEQAQQQSLPRLEQRLSDQSSRLDQQAVQLERLASQWDALRQAQDEATSEDRQTSSQALTAFKQSQQEALDALRRRLEQQQASLTGLVDARLAPLSKTQTSLSSQLGELRRQQTALSAGLEALGEASTQDEQLRSLDASRRQLSGRVASMLSQLSRLEQRVARLER